MTKRVSASCDRNKQPILAQLSDYFQHSQAVLEIGSGTGQHAVFFAEQLPHLHWYTSDMPENHASINAWIKDSPISNVVAPRAFTLGQDDWPEVTVDAIFTANTTHIMQVHEAHTMMTLVAKNLPKGGVFCQYGPMKVNGGYTTASNREFDLSLRQQGFGGIRDIAELQCCAQGMTLVATIPMPANNFILVWRK